MKIDIDKIKLSGKGFYSEDTWTDDNLRIITSGVAFHEIVGDDQHIGWIVNGELRIDADLTAHSKKGMKGESVSDRIEYALIYDRDYDFGSFIPDDLADLPIEEAQIILDKYMQKHKGNINISSDHDGGVIIFSTKSSYVMIHSKKNSVRICEGDVLVLDKRSESIVHVTADKKSINISGDSSIIIKDGKISFDGREFDPMSMISDVMSGLAQSFGSIFS